MNILLTGGTSGLGKAIVIEMAKDKTNNILFTYCHNKVLADQLSEKYRNTKGFEVNFKDPESVENFSNRIRCENIDVLINNTYVGSPLGTYFHKTNAEDFLIAFNSNILPLIRITQCCILGMKKQRFGKIINILTSYLIDVPPTGFSVYTATKAYIRQLSKSLSKEYGRFNISSNCILPEFMNTNFGNVEDFQLEQIKLGHPLKEILSPSEVAEIINHVIHSSQQLNGVEIPVNAAQHIM